MMNSDGTFAEDINCIVPQKNGIGAIFISNIEAASNPNTLKKHGIGAVITAIKGKNIGQKIPKHIEYLYIPVVDHESCNISIFFKDSFDFIEEQRKRTNVLVHCMAGVSRSVTLVIAYIMQKSDAPFQSAFNYVKSKRPIIHPNEAFVEQLMEHEKRLKTKSTPRNENKLENKTAVGFGKIRHEENQLCRSSSQIKHQLAKQFGSKGHDFENFKLSRTDQNWMTKSKITSDFGDKQNQGIDENNYQRKLRQNIKKLFSQANSRVREFQKSEFIR